MSTLKSVNLQHPSSASPNIVLDSSGNATMAGTMAMATPFAIRNKIINGAMEIDQRNAGASVTVTSDGTYGIDRWKYRTTLSSKFSVQRSTVAPPGFTNSLLATSLAATTPGTNDYYAVEQLIEGFNVADLSWGTVNARSVTLSFWVRSSLTGTFGGVIGNAAYNRSYPFTYSISSANTWEYKTVTIPGDTTGTWETGSSTGIDLFFGLGVGSGQSGAAGSWAAAGRVSATGAVNFVGTNGATFYLTGVQLEVGSVATPFERRLYGQELALCQRYYVSDGAELRTSIRSSNSVDRFGPWFFPVTMRAAPTVTGTATSGTFAADDVSTFKADLRITYTNTTDSGGIYNRKASAEL